MRWLQRWRDVLFFHFPVEAQALARLLPRRLEVDTYQDQAWISYVLFRLDLRAAWLPYVPGFSSLTELNLRTYVRHRGQSGIYFLRMYADNPWAIRAARWLTPLDYRLAYLDHCPLAPGVWQGGGESELDKLDFQFEVKQAANLEAAAGGTLDDWLLERYRLFVAGRQGHVIIAEAEHPPWQAARVAGQFTGGSSLKATLLEAALGPPVMHYSPGVSALFREFRRAEAVSDFEPAGAIRPAHAGGGRGGR
jgi:uncharacterized protein